jgi:cyanate permease
VTFKGGAGREDRIYNFVSCLIDAIGFPLGIAFFSSTTILPLLLRRLGADDVLVGALPAIANLLTFLPGFLTVGYLNRRKRVRGYLFWVAIAERLCLLPLVPLTAAWGRTHPDWLIAAVFACLICHTTWMGLNQPAYWVAVGKTIPSQWRGRLFGYAGGLAGVLSIGIERVMSRFLGPSGAFPTGFSQCFLIGFSILIVSMMPLGTLREPSLTQEEIEHSPDDLGPAGLVRQMRRVWADDTGFRRFLYSYIAIQCATIAGPFYILHAVRDVHVSAADAAGFTGTMVFVSSFGGLLWGAWADRAGNRIVLILGALICAFAAMGAVFATTVAAFYAVFAALALGTAGTVLAGFNIVMEFAHEPRAIPVYAATANAITALPRALAPLIGGALASYLGGYGICFGLSAALSCFGALMALGIADPRRRDLEPRRENS